MKSDDGNRSEVELATREAEILKSVIRQHILTGEPIGSRAVSRNARLDLSPATIRAIMAELEERGLLRQPHTSAGRVPTDRAYRVYVDQMMRRRAVPASQALAIDRAMARTQGDVTDLLEEASRQLSSVSNQVGVVLAPDVKRLTVDRLEFIRLDARRVVAILVARSGVVHNRMLRLDAAPDQAELDRIGRYLTDEFGGTTLPRMRVLLERRMKEERAAYDRLVASSLDLGKRTLDAQSQEAGIFVEGASNLVGSPEFSDPDQIRALFRALEEKQTLHSLLSRLLRGDEVQVVIGDENPVSELTRCSVVTSGYAAGDRFMGSVGIVGPTRMEYARAIAVVDYLAHVLTRMLS